MKEIKPLAGVVLVALGLAALAVLGTFAGLGVESQLVGSDWQLPALATFVFIAGALGVYAAFGKPWESMQTTYW